MRQEGLRRGNAITCGGMSVAWLHWIAKHAVVLLWSQRVSNVAIVYDIAR